MNYREAQLRNELKKLQERNNLLATVSADVQNYLDLEQENKDKEYKITSLQQEIKSHEEVLKGLVELLGKEIKTPKDLKNILQGRTLKEWLDHFDNYLEKKEQDYQHIKDKLIAERSEVKNKLTQEKKDRKEIKKELEQLEQDFKKWKEVLGQFLDKYGIKSGKLVDLGKHLEELQEAIVKRDKAVNDFLTKHKAKNYGEVSEKISDLEKDNQAQATKLSQTEKTRKDGEKAFEEIVKLVNKKKTFIFGDLNKKKIKSEMGKLKSIFRWDKVDTEAESGEEG